MRHLPIILSLLLFSLTIISCRDTSKTATTDNETTNNELIGNNNNSILSGYRIGSGKHYNSFLSKSVEISVRNRGGFSYETPYVARTVIMEGSEDYSFYWIIPIRNLQETKCFIRMTSINFYDSSNNLIHYENRSYVTGSIGLIYISTFTNTCLTNGEEGYVSGIVTEKLYNKVHKIVVSRIESSSSESIKLRDPSILVKPISYTTTGTYRSPTITVKNYSEIDIELSQVSTVFLLDSYNRPIYWNFVYPKGSKSISPNNTTKFTIHFFYFSGSVYKIRLFVDVNYPKSNQ